MGRTPGTKNASKELHAVQCLEAYRLRVEQGTSFREIGSILGVSHVTAHARFVEACNSVLTEGAAEIVQREKDRLDFTWQQVSAILTDPTQEPRTRLLAANAGVRVSESIRKLLGVDQPVKVDISGTIKTPTDLAIDQLLDQHEQAIKATEAALRAGELVGADRDAG